MNYLFFSLAILISGLLGLLVWKGFSIKRTFSQKAATSQASTIYYSLLFAVAIPLLYLFFTTDLMPRLQLETEFYVIMTVSLVAQFLCTLLPERGRTIMAHRVVTGISGVLLLPMLLIIALSGNTTLTEHIMTIFSLLCMTGLLIIAGVNQLEHRHALLFQVGYYVLFFAPIILMAY